MNKPYKLTPESVMTAKDGDKVYVPHPQTGFPCGGFIQTFDYHSYGDPLQRIYVAMNVKYAENELGGGQYVDKHIRKNEPGLGVAVMSRKEIASVLESGNYTIS